MHGKPVLFGIIALIILAASMPGCTSPLPPVHNTTPGSIGAVVEGNNLFAMDLYSRYKGEQGNVFFSPFSISSALAMTYEGANGQTATEMASVLHLPQNGTLRRDGYYGLINEINGDRGSVLRTANALWVQNDQPFLASYLQDVQDNYGGAATPLDFKNDPDGSRLQINSWVKGKTDDRIQDLLAPGMITPGTKLVLTNAVYFKGSWATQFNSSLTSQDDFTTSPGTVENVSMMHSTDEYSYMENSQLQMLEMPYSGNLSMLILLPRSEDPSALESSLNLDNLDAWKAGLQLQEVRVSIPKFKFETEYQMSDTLKDMGMVQAFSDSADFSLMTGKKGLKIDQVVHKAFVQVDENGTEAAAATAVVMVGTAMEQNPQPSTPVFRADHPFIFIIQQQDTGNILFMGRVSDPSVG